MRVVVQSPQKEQEMRRFSRRTTNKPLKNSRTPFCSTVPRSKMLNSCKVLDTKNRIIRSDVRSVPHTYSNNTYGALLNMVPQRSCSGMLWVLSFRGSFMGFCVKFCSDLATVSVSVQEVWPLSVTVKEVWPLNFKHYPERSNYHRTNLRTE